MIRVTRKLFVVMSCFIALLVGQVAPYENGFNLSKAEYLKFLRDQSRAKTLFSDIFVAQSAIDEAKEVVDMLKNYTTYTEVGADIPNVVTIQGPPMSGSKSLVKAIAGEAGAYLFELQDWTPEKEEVCRELVKEAPVILFQKDYYSYYSNFQEAIKKISEHNDSKPEHPVILMRVQNYFGCSYYNGCYDCYYDDYYNRNGSDEKSEVRERVIYLPSPDQRARTGLIKKFLKKVTVDPYMPVDEVAEDIGKKATNFSAVQLRNLINEAAVLAARDHTMNKNPKRSVQKVHMYEAFYQMSTEIQTGEAGGNYFVESFTFAYSSEVKFDDVKGLDHVLVEVSEFIEILKDPSKYKQIGIKSPKGLLLEGMPGVGKTLLARAIAGEADCCLITASGAQFVNGWVGGGPESIRELFKLARQRAKNKPVIIFIDEFDSLGKRPEGSGGVANEYRNTINELLKQMDGFKQDEQILVIAATNHADMLDSAILRPGRFDRQVYVPLPSAEGRKDILLHYMKDVSCNPAMEQEVMAIELAGITKGFSGAALRSLVNEAAILAIRGDSEYVEREHLIAGCEKVAVRVQSGADGSEEGFSYTFAEDKRFEDVIGIEAVLEEVNYFLDGLKNSERYKEMGIKRPKGMLLHGPPGTGKTLLARAIAGEAGCCFVSASASQFVKKYVGTGAMAVRRLFKFARKMAQNKPVIIFLDELDSFGKRRSGDGGAQEYNNTINELLSQLDGFTQDENIVVIGCTNNLGLIDDALLRDGRFDLKLKVPLPSLESREALMVYYLNKLKNIDAGFDLAASAAKWAKQTRGYSGAGIETLVSQAAALAVREGTALADQHIEDAYLKGVLGLKNNHIQTEEELEKTAYHEAGHALMAILTGNDVTRLSIFSQGDTLGVMFSNGKHEIFSNNDQVDLLHEIMIGLGGFCAEKQKYGRVTPGASNDLYQVNECVSQMVTKWGMGDGLAGVTTQFIKSDAMKAKFDEAMVAIIEKCLNATEKLMRKYKYKLSKLAKALLDKEFLREEEIYALTGKPNNVADSYLG